MTAHTFKVGQVVQFKGRRRRYLVTHLDSVGNRVNARALSGAIPGSGPSGIDPAELELSPDQTIRFSGKQALTLRSKAGQSLAFLNHPPIQLSDLTATAPAKAPRRAAARLEREALAAERRCLTLAVKRADELAALVLKAREAGLRAPQNEPQTERLRRAFACCRQARDAVEAALTHERQGRLFQ